MNTNGEQEPEVRPMPRLVVKVDSKPQLDLHMERGTTVMVEYRREDPSVQPPSRELSALRREIKQTLDYLDEIGDFDDFVCIRLGLSRKKLGRGNRTLALIKRFEWPGEEREGLQTLLDEALRHLRKERPSSWVPER